MVCRFLWWDTYSAIANCYGGVIILGVKENKDGSWRTTGLQNASMLCKEFWDNMNNPKKGKYKASAGR